MWALNIPAMRIILILQACQLYHTSFYSRELSFFILAPQTPALGDEQAKCIFKFLDTLCVPYAEFKQYFFYLLLLLSMLCLFGCFSSEKDHHSCLSSAAKLQHAALLSLCCWLHLPFTSWSHWHPLLTFLQEFPSDIFCNFLFRFARQVPQ